MVRQVDYGLYRYNNVPLKLLGLQSRDHSGKDNEQLFLQQGTANTINIVVFICMVHSPVYLLAASPASDILDTRLSAAGSFPSHP